MSTRRKLTAAQAIEIFKLKYTNNIQGTAVAKTYGITEKSVRDIWNAKSWAKHTEHLDPHRPTHKPKPIGRPKGSRRVHKRKQKKHNIYSCINDLLHSESSSIWHTPPVDPFARDWQQAKMQFMKLHKP